MPDTCPICGNKECYVMFATTCSGIICDECYINNREYYEEEAENGSNRNIRAEI